MAPRVPLIYNLFPRLFGPIPRWSEWLPQVKAMGFNWIYINPFHFPGGSGSLYSIWHHRLYHPLFIGRGEDFRDPISTGDVGDKLLAKFIHHAHSQGIRVMMDLVIGHAAVDSILVKRRPHWFKWRKRGISHPGARDGNRRVVWGDLAKFNLRLKGAQHGPRDYLRGVVKDYQALGIDGFRCDAAYQVPSHIWRPLIKQAKGRDPNAYFLGENLGGSLKHAHRLRRAGFDSLFNHFCWWQPGDRGFFHSHGQLASGGDTISFVESHDTERVAARLGGNRDVILQRYVLSAALSAGVMMPYGVEFGALQKPHVVLTQPWHKEAPRFDLRGDIAFINNLKQREPSLMGEPRLSALDVGEGVVGVYRDGPYGRAAIFAHGWGPPRWLDVNVGEGARVIYGLKPLEGGRLQGMLMPGEVVITAL